MTRMLARCVVGMAAVAALASAHGAVAAQTRNRTPPPTSDQARERRPEEPEARDRRRPPAPRPPSRPVVRRGAVVFVGGYFYDPYFGPYPWWARPAYPFWYFPRFDDRAEVRVDCRERLAAVYVDGFYAGIVDDFDGLFQRLPLPPGGHRITLFQDGFETADYNVYLRPGSTFTIHHQMVRLAPGETSHRPDVAPPVPPPPEGTYTPPRGAPPVPPSPPMGPPRDSATGWLELHVQPAAATVLVDGERWVSSGEGIFELQLPVGTHRIEVTTPGYRAYIGTIEIHDDERTPLHVSLARGHS